MRVGQECGVTPTVPRRPLSAEVELLDDGLVAPVGVLFEVVEKLTAAARHFEESAAGVEVLAVGPQVLGEVADPCGEQSNLHLTGTCVLVVDLVVFNDFDFV